jgi:uracil-DNA glycosylase
MLTKMSDGYSNLQLEASWQRAIGEDLEKDYMLRLCDFLDSEVGSGKKIYPQSSNVLAALNLTPVNQVKVVILGQDPYHGPGQAHGLSFSVPFGVPVPPSLKNIYKELQQDVGFSVPSHGCLSYWAEQGVLLLNSVLTVESGLAGSHQGKGWETFTDVIITYLNQEFSNLAFILWGNYAQTKGEIIDRDKHLVLTSPHPSPLSASRGFFGNQHFSRTNSFLCRQGIKEVDWQLALTS